jgi:D-galactose 1-dehydrogenase
MKIALVGIGKIAVDQHVPAIAAAPDWDLAATVSRQGTVDGVPAFTDLDAMLKDCPDIRVVSLCLPPVPRFVAAQAAIRAGRHVGKAARRNAVGMPRAGIPGAGAAGFALCDLAFA